MDWLKADNDNNVTGTGLLLAPVSYDVHSAVPDEKIEIEQPGEKTEIINVDKEEEHEEIKNEPEIENNDGDLGLPTEIFELDKKIQEIQNAFEQSGKAGAPLAEIPEPEEVNKDFDENDKEWQERATGFELSLDEPPSELWTGITPEDYDENEDDDEELDYEQGMSLQGAAYVPKAPKNAPGRGANFTERLHQSMKGRKQKAEQLREKEERKKPHHPYKSRALIFCTMLLMVLGLAWFALWFVQRFTPENIDERANIHIQNGEYEEAMNLFYKGYKRYPNILSFLTGVARAAESADRVQTAIAAWEAYSNALPKDDGENKNSAMSEIRRLKGEPEPVPEPEEIKEEVKEEDAKEEIIEGNKEPEPKIPATFDEFLTEANSAYNSKLYNTAIIYFHRAIELKGSDIRAYIGLAAAYQAKGMPADAKIILDEAKRKFKRNPTVETQSKILERK